MGKPTKSTESAHPKDSTTTALKPPRLSARRVKPPSRPADAHARRSEEPRNARRERCSVSPDQRPSAELDLPKPETALKPTRLTVSAHPKASTKTALKPIKLTESAHPKDSPKTALKPTRLTESAQETDSTTTALKPTKLTESAHQTDSTTTALKPIRLTESAHPKASLKELDALARK